MIKKKGYKYIGSTYNLRVSGNWFEFNYYDNEVKFFIHDNRFHYLMDDPPPVKYSTAILDAHHLYGDKGVIRVCGNRFRYLFVNPPPEEYLTTILDVYHDYKLMVVIKKK